MEITLILRTRMNEAWFCAHVFYGNSHPDQTTTLRTPSLLRARSFIDARVEMGAIFGYWIPSNLLDPSSYSMEWKWCHEMIRTTSFGDSWVCAAMGGADAWFANAKNYALIVAPRTYEPNPNPCNKCRMEVAAALRCCPACSSLLY